MTFWKKEAFISMSIHGFKWRDGSNHALAKEKTNQLYQFKANILFKALITN